MIAANNILNALFMVASAVLTGALLHAGLDIPQVFMVLGVATALVALATLLLVPEYLLRFVAWIATHLMYRFEVRGAHHIPAHGPAILVCNHVSFVGRAGAAGAAGAARGATAHPARAARPSHAVSPHNGRGAVKCR